MTHIYTIFDSDNRHIGQTPIRNQAVEAAAGYAKHTNCVMFVEQKRLNDGETRRVQFNPNGTRVQLWKISKVQ